MASFDEAKAAADLVVQDLWDGSKFRLYGVGVGRESESSGFCVCIMVDTGEKSREPELKKHLEELLGAIPFELEYGGPIVAL